MWAAGKHRKTVAARSLLCYYSVRQLGLSMASLAQRLWISPNSVSQSVVRGEALAKRATMSFHSNIKIVRASPTFSAGGSQVRRPAWGRFLFPKEGAFRACVYAEKENQGGDMKGKFLWLSILILIFGVEAEARKIFLVTKDAKLYKKDKVDEDYLLLREGNAYEIDYVKTAGSGLHNGQFDL